MVGYIIRHQTNWCLSTSPVKCLCVCDCVWRELSDSQQSSIFLNFVQQSNCSAMARLKQQWPLGPLVKCHPHFCLHLLTLSSLHRVYLFEKRNRHILLCLFIVAVATITPAPLRHCYL